MGKACVLRDYTSRAPLERLSVVASNNGVHPGPGRLRGSWVGRVMTKKIL